MEWTEDLAIKVANIDEQHKELFARIGALVDSVKRKECKLTFGPTFTFLEEYVVKHFGDEEAIMQREGYPEFDAHKAEHGKFIADLNALKAEIQNEPSSYTRSVMTNQAVVDWILSHIKQRDKRFGQYMREKQG